jgi:hypothetical protein
MEKHIEIPEPLLLEIYQYLVLYGLLHDIGETEMYNTKIKELEKIYKSQTGRDIGEAF